LETFTVVAVIDGNTFEVSPKWEFGDETGNLVQAKGYTAPKSGKGAMAVEQKLSTLIHNKKVELGSPDGVQRNRLVCEVYYRGINIAEYFSSYQDQAREEVKKEQESLTEISEDEELSIEETET
jgi:endonuclease YncB( thermonuclease family)